MTMPALHYWPPESLCWVAQRRPCSLCWVARRRPCSYYCLTLGSCLLPAVCVCDWKVKNFRVLACVHWGLKQQLGFFFQCFGFIWGVVSHRTLGSLTWAVSFLPEFSVPASLVLGLQVATTGACASELGSSHVYSMHSLHRHCLPLPQLEHGCSSNMHCMDYQWKRYHVCSRTGGIPSAGMPGQSLERVEIPT